MLSGCPAGIHSELREAFRKLVASKTHAGLEATRPISDIDRGKEAVNDDLPRALR